MLIEDDAPVRERLARIIRGWPGGQLIASCPTLEDAMRVMDNNPVDLLITDLKLPDVTGCKPSAGCAQVSRKLRRW